MPLSQPQSSVVLSPNHTHKTSPDKYFALTTKSFEVETKRKSWGERWGLSRSPKQEDNMEIHPQFMVHPDYVRKYGTISPGVLARSVKYAETWLYGTVAVRGTQAQRPSLFLYPGMMATPTNQTRPPIPRFVPAGSQRTTRNLCQCAETPRGAICRHCGIRKARPQTRARQSLLGTTSQEQPRNVATAADPYNLMRKSRLGIGETTEKSIINPKTKKRTRSTSPISRKETFETFKPTIESTWVKESEAWGSDSEEDHRPKSILECNVNPYEINKKDESSDDLSDGTLEMNAKLKILRPKLKKTEIKNKKINIPEPKKLPDEEIRLSGQRFRILDRSFPSRNSVEGYVSDKEDKSCEESPKRPPRKAKQNGVRLTKLRSTSSPNLSIKSILKKPCEDGCDSSLNDSTPLPSSESNKALQWKIKKQSQSTLKKKKQVQFNVSNENVAIRVEVKNEEHLESQPNEMESAKNDDCVDVAVAVPSGNGLLDEGRKLLCEEVCEENSDLAEDLLLLPVHCTDDVNDATASWSLKRSLSDRRPASAIVKLGNNVLQMSTSPPNSYLFSDTMALRPRAQRHDTRELFLENLDDGIKAVMKTRPKDPPPPPPPPPSNELVARLIEQVDEKKSNVSLPPPDPPPTGLTKNRSDLTHRVVLENIPTPIKLCHNCENSMPKPKEESKTVVTIMNSELKETPKRTSIIINGKSPASESRGKRTSVIINNFQSEDCNKVRISVRNDEEDVSSCSHRAIIETGCQSTVIPVVSSDNKTTLVVGSSPSPAVKPTLPVKTPPPSTYLFSSSTLLDNMDPVEAVKRNLVPHVCGKEDIILPSLVERIKEEKDKNTTSLKQLSKLFNGSVSSEEPGKMLPESLLVAYQAKKIAQWKVPEESSAPTSRSNSFCGSNKTSSRNTSRSSSFNECNNSFLSESVARSTFYIASDSDDTVTQELDKLEDEYVIRNGVEKKDDNIYETIKEPIYDQVGLKLKSEDESDDDVPPPLPTSLPPSLEELENRASRSIFEGASKYDILSFLVDAKDRVQEDLYLDSRRQDLDMADHRRMESLDGSEISAGKASDSGVDAGPASTSSDSSEDRDSLLLGRKSSADIERNDSGVGSETSQTSRSKWQTSSASLREDPLHLCEDCDQTVETQVTDSGVMYAPLICRKCTKKRNERKEIIQEIVETEEKYGRDLRIILEEFYKPMLVAGLLTPDQLGAIFLNAEELVENSESLTDKLKDMLEIAVEQGDEDLLTVNIGRLFLDMKQMLHAFESYCTRQASAAVLLSNMEKDKELLRIFLRVSQMENAVLRRMNLNSFLMVPVQRVTKYPLLLARLYKVTPPQHNYREILKDAQHSIELHLEHMNAEARDGGSARVWRRFSTSTSRKSVAELELTSIKLRKLAVDLLEWSHDEVRFVLEGRLLFAQPDGNWRRGRTVKLQPVFALLATLGKPNAKYRSETLDNSLAFPCKTGVREATLLLVKEKCGRFTLIREPLYLDKLIVCCETDSEDLLEVQELTTKETYIFKAEDMERTKEWYKQLQYHAQILGGWRKRRNALANIMITGMSYAS